MGKKKAREAPREDAYQALARFRHDYPGSKPYEAAMAWLIRTWGPRLRAQADYDILVWAYTTARIFKYHLSKGD